MTGPHMDQRSAVVKSLFSLLLLGLFLASGGTPASGAAPLREWHDGFDLGDLTQIHVTLEFVERRLNSEVLLPSQWAGQTGLYRAVRNLHTTSPGARISATGDPARWALQISHPGVVALAYDLEQDWSGPLKHPMEHRAVLGRTLFEFTGENGLVAPGIPGLEPVAVRFDFTGLPEGQKLVTSFGTGAHLHFEGDWGEVRNALFAGGEMSTASLGVDGQTVLLAMHGAWSFGPGEIASSVEQILRTERHLWRDTKIPYYAMVIAPYEETSSGGGGSGVDQTFNLFLADKETFSVDTASLLAHEAFHEWNPSGLGSVEDTQRIARFGEGFTTFYQDTVLRQAGVIDGADYLARVNRTIKKYLRSPHIHATNDDLQRTLPADESGLEEPYLRGAMIALWLNSEMERQSGGRHTLSDLLLSLRADRSATADVRSHLQNSGAVCGRRYGLEATVVCPGRGYRPGQCRQPGRVRCLPQSSGMDV